MRRIEQIWTRRTIALLVAVGLSTLSFACHDPKTVEPIHIEPPGDEVVGEVVVTTDFNGLPSSQPYEVLSTDLQGWFLTIHAMVSGGCRDHAYTLHVDPSFRESYPVQTWAYLFDDTEDPCDALFEEEIVLDLTPLVNEYIRAYGEDDEIRIHLYDSANRTGTTVVHYRPTDAPR